MRRWAVLLAIAGGCEAPADEAPAPTAWTYPPEVAAWPLVDARGAIGREQAPQLASDAGLRGSQAKPLAGVTAWQVPETALDLAVLSGTVDGRYAVELVDIDDGRVEFRDSTCKGPVVAVLKNDAICSDGKSVQVVSLDGLATSNWSRAGVRFVAAHRLDILVERSGTLVVLDVMSIEEDAAVSVPPGVTADSIVAYCGDALYSYGADRRLARIAGGKVTWSVALDRVTTFDGCGIDSFVVAAGSSLVALEAATGKPLGRVDGVLGHWDARSGGTDLEVSTLAGVRRWPRELTGAGEPLETLPFGELLASHGELRLVRATPSTAALLDRRGVRAFIALSAQAAALGDRALVAGAARILYPDRYARPLRFTSGRAQHVNVPAELRDLPEGVDAAVVDKLDPALAKELADRGWLSETPIRQRSTSAELDVDGMEMRVAYERGRVVAHLRDVQMVPAWSLEVRGVVANIEAVGDAVLVVLEDGDAYRVDARTGDAIALGGISDTWFALGDLIANAGEGGPVPPRDWRPAAAADSEPVEDKTNKKPAKKAAKTAAKGAAKPVQADDIPTPPRLMTPVPPPAGMQPSYQLTLFDPAGTLRARNDYALPPPVTPGRRAPGAPVVIESGAAVREALVLDATTGDPLRRVRLPDGAIPGASFSTVIDGKPIVGTLLANPVRVVLF
jgi:hypothetical protein